jgi:hypothetical protein
LSEFINHQFFPFMDLKLLSVLGDRRIKCLIKLLKGGECELLKVNNDKLMACDREEVDKVYKLIPEFDVLRRQGYDVVCKLVVLTNRLRSENISDLAVAVATAVNVMFGAQVSEEDARKIGEVAQVVGCVKIDEDGIEVDNECLDKLDVPDQLKDQVRTLSVLNLVWS